ncbi:SufS family cysteine desulfurase [bacterium]|nr:MAG: SufS family cysteine desulfurase [bacterium]QQR61487.1 MAG: SufS family cysteine desulfurase [bacterium]QQR62986.1 MAG: SufS family cysteine desulfurase [bacterium]
MKNIKKDFPIFQRIVNGHPLIYLDNAATTQKPNAVIDAMNAVYRLYNSNVHRGVYTIAEEATAAYEQARQTVADFINAYRDEIVFTQGTTASINTIAYAWALQQLKKGDRIVVTEIEHHANLIPWQFVAEKTGAELAFIPALRNGLLDETAIEKVITPNTKLVAFALVSHILRGQIPAQRIIKQAKNVGAAILVDAAQAAGHMPLDTKALDIDFLAFSGHKMFGPTGIGVLFVARKWHEIIEPFFKGGAMVATVTYEKTTFQPMPQKLEAGTPPIVEAIGLAAAIEYIAIQCPFNQTMLYEQKLSELLLQKIAELGHVKIVGPQDKEGHMLSFTVENMHAHDVATALDMAGICVRAGTHCAQPIARKLGVSSWLRASIAAYNSPEDIDKLIDVLKSCNKKATGTF